MSRVYCDTMTKPEGFNNVTLYHGFNAFHVGKPYEYKFNTLMNHPERQICTSTKYLGMMGVTVTGDVLMASSYDLCSCIDETGRRYFDSVDMDSIVYNYNDIELHEDDNEENNEIIVQHSKITALWITSDAPSSLRQLVIRLSKEYNLPVLEVGESIFN